MSSNGIEAIGIRTIAAGVGVLAIGVVASLIWRRQDVPLWKWLASGSYIATYPERYVIAERAPLVRSICVIGLGVVLLGAVTAFIAGIKW